jgi:hypothetical protein
MNPNLFKCAYCLLDKNFSELGGEITKNVDKLQLQKKIWEDEITKMYQTQFSTSDKNKQAELEREIQSKQKELENIAFSIKNSKEQVCKTCWNKFEKKDISTFICAVCKQNITGKKLGGHIQNYQDEGIPVRKWVNFCQSCKNTRIIMANIYCPRTGDGRDGDWDITRPLFDCDCPVPEEKQIV